MQIPRPFSASGLLSAGTLLASVTAQAATHNYVPVTFGADNGIRQGLWLADTGQPGVPPYQISNQVLDGNAVAILHDWTYDTVTHRATAVQARLAVYGVGGHLYKEDLTNIGPVQAFANTGYSQLCSLTALDDGPFRNNRGWVQAVVEPAGSSSSCASGTGTQTWLIPASADQNTSPTVEPANWTVLDAFTVAAPGDGSLVDWLVWTGTEIDAYSLDFSSHSTLLVGPSAGRAPAVLGRSDGTAFLVSSGDDGVNRTDSIYRVTTAGSALLGTFSYADHSVCSAAGASGYATTSLMDPSTGLMVFTEPSNTGYNAYVVSIASGLPRQIYISADNKSCGSIAGDTFSGAYVGLNEADTQTGFNHVISIRVSGGQFQSAVLLTGVTGQDAFIRYTINGHFWINQYDHVNNRSTELVMDGSGSLLQEYDNAVIADDSWHSFSQGFDPSVIRDAVYLFSPGASGCTGGSLTSVNPSSFAATSVSGVPTDACSVLAYGWDGASVAELRQPAGFSPAVLDLASARLYPLLGSQGGGSFFSLETLPSYPFF